MNDKFFELIVKDVNSQPSVELTTNEFKKVNKFYEQRKNNFKKEFDDKYSEAQANAIMKLYKFNTDHPYDLGSKIEIRDSNIHGKGAFALKNLEVDEIVTFYPAHGFGFDDCKLKLHCVDEQFMKSELSNDYINNISSNFSIFGMPTILEKNILGHIINDSRALNISEDSVRGIRNAIYRYCISDRSNCIILSHNLHCYSHVVTTRNILAGEELFVNYGEEYWLHKRNPTCDWHKILDSDDISSLRAKQYNKTIEHMF